jgi:serine protease
MAKKILLLSAALLLMTISCSRDDSEEEIQVSIPASQKDPLESRQINETIKNEIRTKGSFNWRNASNHLLWSAVYRGESIVSIGFGNSENDIERAKLDNNSQIQSNIVAIISRSEGVSESEILIASDAYLNTIDVVIHKQETIIALRRSKQIRYIEPGNYRFFEVENSLERSDVSSGSGCGFDPTVLSAADYTDITPNAKAAWTLYKHNIPSAWTYSTGAGITIGIVDTGVSQYQTLLGSSFNDGLSSGRTIQKFGVYVDSAWPWSTTTDGPNDKCGHGTSMASAATAPRNDNGLPVGVAYNANLVMYRAAANVVLDGYHEQNGVKNAFTALGNNANVKIISMSMGHIFSVGKIQDGIRYAYGKGKLIFCAGGTSTSLTTFVGVTFPATMAETVAVTGVKEGVVFQKCNDCHSGSKIEFTVVMERTSTLNHTPVLSYYDAQADYVGGSSVATATTAGIAALVWSVHPTWTRDQVLTKMRQSGNFYPNRNSEFGYGNVNALLAVQ